MVALPDSLAQVSLDQEEDEEPEDKVDSHHHDVEGVVVPVPGVGVDFVTRSCGLLFADLGDEFT